MILPILVRFLEPFSVLHFPVSTHIDIFNILFIINLLNPKTIPLSPYSLYPWLLTRDSYTYINNFTMVGVAYVYSPPGNANSLIQHSLRYRRSHIPASLNVNNTKRFFPAIALEQKKRLSELTDFYDTEYEASDSDEESLRKSLDSVSKIVLHILVMS